MGLLFYFFLFSIKETVECVVSVRPFGKVFLGSDNGRIFHLFGSLYNIADTTHSAKDKTDDEVFEISDKKFGVLEEVWH